ncbi:MaoC family dehydratase N-terminal domain-containing protein [Paracoccus sp. TK19116]|uniref:MaoC family dehydratase N-terminal domain-containing protein n=1 Tax=Paracoccus albicereus TaxID=2922394 RepID=A0ABT1MPJ3_9RHOB|nr:MaoC family dehydratase N-terminal domain-containing protein [Paracoccus albicereus]MCQ0970212.1 MaoC family dehydratase N-terminal domain-containing protein [Paracoccus albicereus]
MRQPSPDEPASEGTAPLDIEHLREWVGREETVSEMVTEALVSRFRATFDLPGDARAGEDAPSMIHLCLAPPTAPTSALGPDGHPVRGGFLPPVPLPRRMWAGGAFTFHGTIRIGETVTRHSTVRDVTAKRGRLGDLCFVTVDHRIESDGRLAIEERHDIVYRAANSKAGTPQPSGEAAPHGTYRVDIEPSAARLFRYSALTFNGHRIHYDNPYTRGTEGYPGLIVHGPLQATQLVQFATTVRGMHPKRFDFRSLSPLFDIADYTLNASEDDDGLKLWTSYADGPVAMDARATW